MEWWSNGVMHLPPPTFDFSTRWGACPERKSKDRFFARLASQIFLSSLQTQLQPFFTKHWLREPLVHFLLIGLALFVVYCLLNPVPGDRYHANRIELTGDNLRQMTIEWLAQGRPPSTPKQMVSLDGRFPTEVIKP